MAEVTVVFTDITGSTRLFESLGNTKATQAITRLTKWIADICEAHQGRVVKYLGDGVLMTFAQSRDAIETVVVLQGQHQKRIRGWSEPFQMRLQVGLARGEVVEQDGDCYGDAVNVASRLCDLAGPDQILATDSVMAQLPADTLVRSRRLGAMTIRGRAEPCMVHRIEWQSEVLSETFTLQAVLLPKSEAGPGAAPQFIELSWLDLTVCFSHTELPLFLGRDTTAHFEVPDPRVSRKHARIEWRAGRFYFEDVSSYGSSVRFSGSTTAVALRRQGCVLLMKGEIALGASFEDLSIPVVRYRLLTEKLSAVA